MKFHQVEEVFNKYLHLENNRDFLPTVLATVIANRLDALPVWMIFMAKASSSKSEVLASLEKSVETLIVSKITDKSFASNINMQSKGMKGQKEPSLLSQLNGKNLIVRDATALITLPEDKRRSVFSDLRTAFDGKFEASSGANFKKFEAKFGCMIAATEALERSYTMEAELGERFLTFRLNPENQMAVWNRISEHMIAGEGEMKEALADAAVKFLNACPTPPELMFPSVVIPLANCIAFGRTHVYRDKYHKVKEIVEVSEAPFRVGKQLAALYTGLMTVTENHRRAENILKKVARDSIKPHLRSRVVQAILNGENTQAKIRSYLAISDSAVQFTLQDLGLIGLIQRKPGIQDKRERVIAINPGFDVPFRVAFGGQ